MTRVGRLTAFSLTRPAIASTDRGVYVWKPANFCHVYDLRSEWTNFEDFI